MAAFRQVARRGVALGRLVGAARGRPGLPQDGYPLTLVSPDEPSDGMCELVAALGRSIVVLIPPGLCRAVRE
ncbi:hypothetical protein ACWGQU_21580, partial [[Kitasatospora] papulosa]